MREAIRATDVNAINQAVHEGKPTGCAPSSRRARSVTGSRRRATERDVDKAKEFLKTAGLDSLDLALVTGDSDDKRWRSRNHSGQLEGRRHQR